MENYSVSRFRRVCVLFIVSKRPFSSVPHFGSYDFSLAEKEISDIEYLTRVAIVHNGL